MVRRSIKTEGEADSSESLCDYGAGLYVIFESETAIFIYGV
jgi:hypothetical protein